MGFRHFCDDFLALLRALQICATRTPCICWECVCPLPTQERGGTDVGRDQARCDCFQNTGTLLQNFDRLRSGFHFRLKAVFTLCPLECGISQMQVAMTKLFLCPGSGNCLKPWLAVSQTGRPFELISVDVLAGEQKSPDYLRINPLGVVPYLITSDGAGIGESNAMLWYLAENTPLMPPTAQTRAEALQWMFFEQSKLEPFISPARFFTTILPSEKHAREVDIRNWQLAAEPGLRRLEAHLSGRSFVLDCGYSVVDIALFGYVHVLEEAGLSLADYPATVRWIDTVTATDGFRPLSDLGLSLARAA